MELTNGRSSASPRRPGVRDRDILETFFPGDSEVTGRMRRLDWTVTAPGPPAAWPDTLRSALRLCLTARFPMHLWWGPALTLFYNDACISFLGKDRHPAALGRSGQEAWPEMWPTIGPMIEGVLATGQARTVEDVLMFVDRACPKEEAYVTFSSSPLLGAAGKTEGIFCVCAETTEKVVGQRRIETLRRLSARATQARTRELACRTAAEALAANPHDVPFAAIYLLENDRRHARLIASAGLVGASPLPAEVALGLPARADRWRIAAVGARGRARTIGDLSVAPIRGGPWPDPTRQALVLPIRDRLGADHRDVAGVLVAGLSPRRAVDPPYRSFFDMVAEQIGAAVAGARSDEAERRRSERLPAARKWTEPRRGSSDKPAPAPALTPAPTIEDEVSGARVLIAAVHADRRASLTRLIGQRWSVTAVGDQATALTVARRTACDLILADARLPSMSGATLLEAVRADPLLKAVPIIVLSERSGDKSGARGLPDGADDYLVRPFATRELLARVTLHLRLARHRHLAADNAALVRLHELGGDLLSRRALPDVLQSALDAAVALASAQMGTLQLRDAKSNVLQIVAQSGFDQAFVGFFKTVRSSAPSVCGEALRRRQRVIVEDVATDARLRRTSEGVVLATAGVAAVQSTPILARDGSVLGMLSTHWRAPHRPAELTLRLFDLLVRQLGDLIENRRAADALHSTEAALREANRRKDEFISILSHELRNPLAPITTAVQLMRMHGDRPSSTELDLIDRQARHMARLVDDLLDVTRITQGRVPLHMRPLRIKEIIARGVEMALPLIEERRHRLEVREASAALRVRGDEDRLSQIVGNLLTNAAKYTNPGGVIAVRTRKEGDRLAIEVEDNGVGITPELLPHVFDLFVQARQPADRARGGLGIGLTIVRSLVEMHGGEVLAQSPGPGRGALFTVRLPAGPEAPVPSQEPKPAALAARRRRLRILLVDDNPDILQPLARLLEQIGHDVRTAGDGPSALKLVRTFAAQVAIIDIGLPVMDGHTLAIRLLAQLGKTAPSLIALSGYGQAADRAKSEKAGFALHMTKPVDPQALLKAIEGAAMSAVSRTPAPPARP